MHIFLLDRNIISLMGEYLISEEIEKNKHKIDFVRYPYVANDIQTKSHGDMLKFLLGKDHRWNFFSVITSAIEGGYGRSYDVEEYKKSLISDGEIVRKFFHSARTDVGILEHIHKTDEFNSLIIKELNIEKYELYINEMAPLSRSNDINTEDKKRIIFNKADELDIPRGHFVVIVCLSSAFGCKISREILKRKKRRSGDGRPPYYNVLNDIMIASRIGQFMALDKSTTYEFITMEKSLSTFLKLCKVTSSSTEFMEDCVRTNITTSPDIALFPNLTQEEYKKLVIEEFDKKSDI
ncbi:hypothetical protein [Acetobacter senegalensis]